MQLVKFTVTVTTTDDGLSDQVRVYMADRLEETWGRLNQTTKDAINNSLQNYAKYVAIKLS